MPYTIRNINAWSAFKFGGVIGGIVFFFPGLAMGVTIRLLVSTLRTWLESWLTLNLPVLGSISLLDVVKLNDFLARLQQWDSRSWVLVLLVLLVSMVGGGLVMSLLCALGAAVYNLVATVSGGIVVEAEMHNGMRTIVDSPLPAPAAMPVAPATEGEYASVPPPMAAVPPTAPLASEEAAGWLVAQTTQHRWPVGRGETHIGSGPHNQIRLDGLAMNHAIIRWEDGRFILYDYSGGQTWVNGRSLVGPNMLKAGFQVRLANQDFLFQT